MKTKLFLAVITIVIICGWTRPMKSEFLFLNSNQLKQLGIELNENGVFYKNLNPNWKQDNVKYPCLSFYCSNDNYLTTNHYSETDVIEAKNNTSGKQSLDNETLSKDLKLFPVAICMSETKLLSRKDTIVVWFKPTEALKKALPENIKFEDYLIIMYPISRARFNQS
jgi:hypothetical protein